MLGALIIRRLDHTPHSPSAVPLRLPPVLIPINGPGVMFHIQMHAENSRQPFVRLRTILSDHGFASARVKTNGCAFDRSARKGIDKKIV
jgi:hypothetical protein